MCRVLFAVAMFVIATAARAQTSAAVTETAPGMFDVGNVKVDQNARTASFLAEVNMRDGLVEYLLVTESGKTHESVFTTKIDPANLHVAMLLLGAKGFAKKTSAPPGQIDASYLRKAPELGGEQVEIIVKWPGHEARAEDFIFKKNAPAARGFWVYNGSFILEGKFLARLDGSIIALVTDPAALINNPRPGHENDHIWSVRTEAMPSTNTAVEITLQLAEKKPARP